MMLVILKQNAPLSTFLVTIFSGIFRLSFLVAFTFLSFTIITVITVKKKKDKRLNMKWKELTKTYASFPPPNTPAAWSESWPALGFFVKIFRTKVSNASFTREFSFAWVKRKR